VRGAVKRAMVVRKTRRWPSAGFSLILVLFVCFALAQEKREDKKDEKKTPEVMLTLPLGLVRGQKNQLTIRGLRLDGVTEVRVEGAKTPLHATTKPAAKPDPAKKSKAETANMAKVGSAQLDVEVDVPADIDAAEVTIVVVTPDGQSKPYASPVLDRNSLIEEKEPNGGFAQAQEIQFGKTVRGSIQPAADVDVYRFAGTSGQKIVAEVKAARYGSSLDSLLTLYDAKGHVLAINDDGESGADSLLRAVLPADGVYYLALNDANDRGAPTQVYLLSLREAK
jgi:hypothetical protein